VAPEKIKTLMMQQLETARAVRPGERMDAEEMARQQRQSELTVRDLLATEGWFSPSTGLSGDAGSEQLFCAGDGGCRLRHDAAARFSTVNSLHA